MEAETEAAREKIIKSTWENKRKGIALAYLSDEHVKRLRSVPDELYEATLGAISPQGTVNSSMEAKLDEQYSFSGSKTGKSKAVGAAMMQLNLRGDTPGELPTSWPQGYEDYTFTPYEWPAGTDEDTEAPNLRKHCEGELAKLKVPLGRGGFQVQDVRRQDRLSFEGTTRLVFSGGTDAAVTPFGSRSWWMQVCEVIKWKTPVILKDFDSVDDQMKLELLGALYSSNRPTMAICTDLNNFTIHVSSGKEIQYYHTFDTDDAGHISTTNAMRLIAYFLTEVSSKECDVKYQDLASVPEDSLLGQLSVPLLMAKKLARAWQIIWSL
ncbi:g2768 [Coccomyxa elongata]